MIEASCLYLRMSNEDTEDLKWKILNITNTISLVAAIVTCIILVGLGFFKYKHVDRVSLRFQGLIALIDIARHLSLFKTTYTSEIACQAFAFLLYFTDLLYVLLNVTIGLNIQLMLIRHIRPNNKLQWWYGLISVIIALIFSLIPLVMGKYSLTTRGLCRLNDDKNRMLWNIALVYFITIPGISFCLYIFILVLLQVRLKKQRLRLIRGSESNFGKDPFRFVWTLYTRVSLYPLSCFITLFPYILASLLRDATGTIPPGLTFLFRFFRRITGILNFVTMLYDPHCQIALIYLWNTLISKNYAQNLHADVESPPSQSDINLSTPYHHELEYPNGDRIILNDYIRFL